MHYGGENLGGIGEGVIEFRPVTNSFLLLGSNSGCRVSSKQSENCDCRRVDRHTDRQKDVTDTCDFIVCPMLCYNNGTCN